MTKGKPRGSELRIFLLSRPEEADIIVPLIAAAHAESPFASFPFSEGKARQRIVETFEEPQTQVGFFVKSGDRVVGLAKVAVAPYYLSDDGLFATCVAIYVHPEIRRSLLGARVAALLLRAMKVWALAQGATVLAIHGTNGYVGRMARGAKPIGVNVLINLQAKPPG